MIDEEDKSIMTSEPSLTATKTLETRTPPAANPRQGREPDLSETNWLRLVSDAAPAEVLPHPEPRRQPVNRGCQCSSLQTAADSPQPPPEWKATTTFLSKLARSPLHPQSWWTADAQFRATFETRIDSTCCAIDARSQQQSSSPAAISLQLTLAGFGLLQLPGAAPQVIGPGKAFFAVESSEVRHCLPEESPGWTFARIEIFHPYLKSRLTDLIRASGPLLEVRPGDVLTASVVRLVRGALARDFRDRFEAELALFDFALACERCARRAVDGIRETQRLMDDVRSLVLARLPAAIEVSALAEKFGMSRSYFSHLFHEQTGITPAHFATEIRIRQVEQMLLDTRESLKSIAAACGFANANHLCKVFCRFRHHTPTAFRQSLRDWRIGDRPLACTMKTGW